MTKNKYTEFYDVGKGVYEVWNIIYNIKVGVIRKARMGKWMHWCLSFTQDFMEQLVDEKKDLDFSNGCLKEISKFITSLYSKEKKEKEKNKEEKGKSEEDLIKQGINLANQKEEEEKKE